MSFKINKVYTRSGDKGQTTLADGKRYNKDSDVINAVGSLDELNVELGAILDYIDPQTDFIKNTILEIQQEVFDIGGELAIPNNSEAWQIKEQQVKRLESICDNYGEELEELSSFILPGGSKLATSVHRARTTCRKAERQFSKLDTNPQSLAYLNRLSDVLFNVARLVLKRQDKAEITWVPAKKRNN